MIIDCWSKYEFWSRLEAREGKFGFTWSCRERIVLEERSKQKKSENEIAEFPQREIDRPNHISPPICWVKIQTGGMSPI